MNLNADDQEHFLTALSLVAAIAIFVIGFRFVRAQYGPTLASQPNVVGGPGRLLLLLAAGLILGAMSVAVVGLCGIWDGACSMRTPFGLYLALSGGLLIWTVVGYWRLRRFRPRNTNIERVSFQASRRYIKREIALTIAPWVLFALLAEWTSLVLPGLDISIVATASAVAFLAVFTFQIAPHALLEDKRIISWGAPSLLAMLRDFLIVASVAWLLLVGDRVGLDSADHRVLVLLPPIFGMCCLCCY